MTHGLYYATSKTPLKSQNLEDLKIPHLRALLTTNHSSRKPTPCIVHIEDEFERAIRRNIVERFLEAVDTSGEVREKRRQHVVLVPLWRKTRIGSLEVQVQKNCFIDKRLIKLFGVDRRSRSESLSFSKHQMLVSMQNIPRHQLPFRARTTSWLLLLQAGHQAGNFIQLSIPMQVQSISDPNHIAKSATPRPTLQRSKATFKKSYITLEL